TANGQPCSVSCAKPIFRRNRLIRGPSGQIQIDARRGPQGTVKLSQGTSHRSTIERSPSASPADQHAPARRQYLVSTAGAERRTSHHRGPEPCRLPLARRLGLVAPAVATR